MAPEHDHQIPDESHTGFRAVAEDLPLAEVEWAAKLAGFLRSREESRAAEWDDAHTEISVGTIGSVDLEALREALQETLSSGVSATAEPGGLDIRVQRMEQSTRIEKQHGCEEVTRLWTWRKVPWPSAEEAAGMATDETEDWRKLAVLAATCGLFGLAGLVTATIGSGPVWLPMSLYVAAMVAGGWDAAGEALPGLVRGKPDVHFLMLAVAVGASLIGAHGEGALLLFLFSTAGALEHFALHRTKREINALFHLAPKTACLVDAGTGTERLVPIEQVRAGDRLIIRPGDTFPVDAVVISGESAADESALTGEAHPVSKAAGDPLSSGTQNLWGAVVAECIRPASRSSLQKVIDLIQKARTQRAPSQRLTDRFGPGYTLGVLGATAMMFFVWWLVLGVPPFQNAQTDAGVQFSAFYRAMTLLVVASPCALVLSIPSAILAAIAWGAKHGILFRGGAAIEQLADVQVVALDKTGTLTTGDLRVVSVESFPPGREQDVAEMAFTMEQMATHPIARAILRHGRAHGLRVRPMADFRSLSGRGVTGRVGDEPCLLGRRELLADGPLADWVRNLPGPPAGLSEVWFVHGELIGRILLEDRIRDASAPVLRNLRSAGLHTVMLTGDHAEAARAVGERLGLSEIRAGLTPEGKIAEIERLKAGGKRVAMIGDGINDAPSLAAADIAVAMGARGSDAALEQSDVVLMNDKIENFFAAFLLSQRSRRIIRQNIAISLGTIAVMVAAAVFGMVPISLGVLAHEGSTVVVCLNSMRLLRGKT